MINTSTPRRPRALVTALLVAVLAALAAVLPAVASAAPSAVVPTSATVVAAVPGEESGLPVRALSSLPPQASDTYRLIRQGGPFPYSQDGTTFQNREGILPAKPTGYYKEYTVPTPGASDRGTRRMITGSGGEVYYTPDHYSSFVVVDTSR